MNGRSPIFRGEVARVAMGLWCIRESSEEAQADAKSSQGKSSLQDLAHQSWAHLLRLYDLRFTIPPTACSIPRFLPSIIELLHALVVTCVNKDMIYPHFIHGLQVLIPQTTNRSH